MYIYIYIYRYTPILYIRILDAGERARGRDPERHAGAPNRHSCI